MVFCLHVISFTYIVIVFQGYRELSKLLLGGVELYFIVTSTSEVFLALFLLDSVLLLSLELDMVVYSLDVIQGLLYLVIAYHSFTDRHFSPRRGFF
jgi:hypothetical protein